MSYKNLSDFSLAYVQVKYTRSALSYVEHLRQTQVTVHRLDTRTALEFPWVPRTHSITAAAEETHDLRIQIF